jgi:chaperonin GroES
MKINPIRDRILVKPLDQDTVTASGIVIPDNAQEKPMQGQILSAGTGKVTEDGVTIPMVVKTGDKVMYGKYSGQTVRINNEDHLILKEDEILAIVE